MIPPLRVFLDADVIIAGSASPDGASHAMLQVAELGLVDGWTSTRVLEEVRRNLWQKLPRALPIFEGLWPHCLHLGPDPDATDMQRVLDYAHVKDVHVVAAALRIPTHWLLTFNVRHFHSPPGLVVLRPGEAIQRLRTLIGQLAESAPPELAPRCLGQ